MILLLMLPFFTSTTFAKKKIQLKYRLHLGDTYAYTVKSDQDISFDANGQTVTLNEVLTMGMTMQIESGKETKTFKVNTVIDKIRMNQTMFGMKMYYNSEDSSTYSSGMGQKMGEAFNKILHKSFATTLDEVGNVKAIDMSNLGDDGNDISEKLNQSANFATFPDHRVGEGDRWESEGSPLKNIDMKVHTVYTLLKIKGKKVMIHVESTITSDKDSETNIHGTQTGEITVNRKTGWTTHSTIHQELKMNLNQNGTEIPADLSSTVEITSKKK